MIDLEVILFLYCSPPSGGRFRYRVPSKGQGKGPPERTKRAGALSRTEAASGGQVLLLARHASENASGAAGGCPQSVESAVLRASENASRTVGGRFWYRISLPYQKSLFFTPNASENASRTRGGCFAHRMSTPYHRRAFPVPSPQRQAAAAAELRIYKARGRPLVDLLLYYTVMSHVFGMLRKR